MSKRIVVDPITRIEGHLRVEADIENGKNTEVFTLMAALTTLGKGLAITDRRIALDQIGDLFNEED